MKSEVTFCLKIEIMIEMKWLKGKLAFSAIVFFLAFKWILFCFRSRQAKTNSADVAVYDETTRPESSQGKLRQVSY